MRTANLTFPEIAAIAGTRVALGSGLGMLCSEHLSAKQRKSIAWWLVGFGITSSVPLIADVLWKMAQGAGSSSDRERKSTPNKPRRPRRAAAAARA
jgi:hypothetical protein